MECPSCDKFISHAYLLDEDIEANDEFQCPSCNEALRYCIDEGTYHGAMHTFLEIV